VRQFVELAYAYQGHASLRIDDFIQFVETQRVADPTSAGIRVMTIHQAKGLEFDTVVLPELDFALAGQPDSFVVERDDPTGPIRRVCHYVSQELQPLLPQAVQHMLTAATDRLVTESLCVFYVALTRAVRELRLIVAPSPGNERNLPKTYAGVLRATLCGTKPVPPETRLFETGDSAWWSKRDPETVAPAATSPHKQPELVHVQLAPVTGRRRRGLERTSPSSLEGGSRVVLGDVLRETNREVFLRGTVLHAMFEQVTWLEEGLPDIERVRRAAEASLQQQGGSMKVLPQLLADFEAMLQSPALNRVLRRAEYASLDHLGFTEPVVASTPESMRLSVETERAFAIRDGDRLIRGSIDRLVLIHLDGRLRAADILDFKSDSVDPADRAQVEHRKAFYRPQMAAYRLAVKSMTGLAPGQIATRLVFATANAVEAV
jgi:ATP-dependent exoDNAse (exonuclease V) beta subunit